MRALVVLLVAVAAFACSACAARDPQREAELQGIVASGSEARLPKQIKKCPSGSGASFLRECKFVVSPALCELCCRRGLGGDYVASFVPAVLARPGAQGPVSRTDEKACACCEDAGEL